MRSRLLLILVVSLAVVLYGCGSSSSSNTPTETTDVERSVYYPENLTVTSPLVAAAPVTSESRAVSSFSDQLSTITTMLSAGAITACSFDPSLFLNVAVNANCYGPQMQYFDHQDSPSDADGTLPTGDLGMWTENEGATTEACSAAQMNARMDGVSNKSHAAFTAMASMICVNFVGGHGIPSNSTNDILTDMNTMATSTSMSATFTTATIAHSTVGTQEEFVYTLEYSYTAPDTTVYPMEMIVTHRSSSSGDYTGRFQYKFDQDGNGGNCPTVGADRPQTLAGSVLYARTGTQFSIDARYASFCGNSATGFVSGVVDPSDKYNATTNTDGWADNFNRFVASFNETTYLGDYTYSWQAGHGDSNTRVLNINVAEHSTDPVLVGDAWFGYGDDMETTDNSIGGFICNWAGPGNSHTYSNLVQFQELEQDATTNTFETTSSYITYAPAVSCDDTDNDFYYDTDADGDMSDETTTENITNNLRPLTEYTSGFTVPTPPSNF